MQEVRVGYSALHSTEHSKVCARVSPDMTTTKMSSFLLVYWPEPLTYGYRWKGTDFPQPKRVLPRKGDKVLSDPGPINTFDSELKQHKRPEIATRMYHHLVCSPNFPPPLFTLHGTILLYFNMSDTRVKFTPAERKILEKYLLQWAADDADQSEVEDTIQNQLVQLSGVKRNAKLAKVLFILVVLI